MSEPAAAVPPAEKSPYEQARSLAAAGLSTVEIKRRLVERGLDEESAGLLAQAVGPPPLKVDLGLEDLREDASAPRSGWGALTSETMTGGFICLVGIGITVLTYAVAAESRGTYVIAYGAIIGGAVQFFRGLARR